MNRTTLLGALAMVLALATAGSAWWTLRPAAPQTFDALGLETLTPEGFAAESYRFLPMVLTTIYDAFGRTEEAEIYDRLATVASGPALEQLYLERVGAMAGGGLEPDQEIHEIALLGLSSEARGDAVSMAAEWRVLGIVGHAEHMHMRGNAYAADLVMEPVDGAWRLTGFTLTDVDRSEAGTLTVGDPDEAPGMAAAAPEETR